MKFFRLFYLLFLIGGVAGVLQAQNSAGATPGRVPGPRRIIVTTQSGATILGNLMRLDPDKLEMVGANGLRIIAVDDIKSIVFDHSPEGEPGNSTSPTETEAHTIQPPDTRAAPTVAPVPKQTPPPKQGVTQDPPRGYTKPRDRPSRRGSREAARKLEEINRQREPKEPDNTGGNNPPPDERSPAPEQPDARPPAPDNSATVSEEEAAAEAARREAERLERERAKRLARERAARERAARERKERAERERREKLERERKEREERERAERERKERAERERNNNKDRNKERGKDKKSETKKEVEKKPAKKPEPARKGRKG